MEKKRKNGTKKKRWDGKIMCEEDEKGCDEKKMVTKEEMKWKEKNYMGRTEILQMLLNSSEKQFVVFKGDESSECDKHCSDNVVWITSKDAVGFS